MIVVKTAAEQVVAQSAINCIAANATIERVIAAKAVDHILYGCTGKEVVQIIKIGMVFATAHPQTA